MIQRKIINNGIVADFFHNKPLNKKKAIIMLGGSEGGKTFSNLIWKQQVIKRLLEKGYNVLSLAYFNAPGLPKSLEEIPLEYFEKTFDWLSHQEEVIPDEYAVVGASKGAEIALLLGSRYKQVRAVVGLSPSSLVWQGIPSNRLRIGKNPKSSWSFEGKGLPYIPSSLSSKDWIAILTLRLRRIAEKDLENYLKIHNVMIPVEKTNGPILFISAKKDRVWPSTLMADQIIERLSDSEFKYKYKHIAYDKGHSMLMMAKSTWRTVFDFLEEQFN